MNDNKINDTGSLHGNNAKIDTKKNSITPLFENSLTNVYTNTRDRYGRAYQQLDVDEELALLGKKEVDSNPLS